MKINKITEQINSRTKNIDQFPIEDILKSINDEDKLIAKQVEKAIPNISAFVDHAVSQIKKTGRLIYIGSGTSGRLGVLDASECPPTFGVSSDLVLGIISGGDRALRESVENAEDSYRNSIHDLNKISLNNNDILIQFCKNQQKINPVDYYILGHNHNPEKIKLDSKCTYINTGDWLSHFSYAILFDGKIELKKYNN